jgi:hypothetical protein
LPPHLIRAAILQVEVLKAGGQRRAEAVAQHVVPPELGHGFWVDDNDEPSQTQVGGQ